MTRTTLKNQANKKLSNLSGSILQHFLDQASTWPGFAEACDGIFCGSEGKIHEPLSGDYQGLYLTFGWYTVSDKPKIEYAYVS